MVSTHLPVKLYISAQKTNTSYPLPLYIQPTPQACILFSANHGIRMRPVFRMVLHVCMLILRGRNENQLKQEERGGGRRKRYQVFPLELRDKPQLRCSAQDFNSFFFLAGFSEGNVRDIIWPGVQFLCTSHVCFITSIWKNCK